MIQINQLLGIECPHFGRQVTNKSDWRRSNDAQHRLHGKMLKCDCDRKDIGVFVWRTILWLNQSKRTIAKRKMPFIDLHSNHKALKNLSVPPSISCSMWIFVVSASASASV